VMENLVQNWATKDIASAINWVGQQPAGGQREQYVGRIAFALSQTSPAEAARFIVQQIPAAAQEEPAIMVLHRWANQDFKAASAWVAAFPAGPLRERAIKELEGIQEYRAQLNQPAR